jgi:hypothetical protein
VERQANVLLTHAGGFFCLHGAHHSRLCIPAGFPGIPAGTLFLQIFYRNFVPAKHRKDRNGLSSHLAFVRRSRKTMDRLPEIP